MDWQHISDYGLGSREFTDLSSLEQDIALVWDFQTLFEMEGFTHFFTYRSGDDVERLIAFMNRFSASNVEPIRRVLDMVRSNVLSWDQEHVDSFFCDVTDDVDAEVDNWGDQYYAGVDRMWDELDSFLEREGLPRRPTPHPPQSSLRESPNS